MKQHLYSLVFAISAVFCFNSCANEVEGETPVQGDSKISASIEKAQLATDEETHGISTRAAFNTDWSFFWTKKDKISVGVERNGEHSFATYMLSTGENTNSGTFVGSIVTGSTISGHVVYPSSLKPSVSGSVLTIDKPQTITYTKEQETLGFENVNPVDMPMYAHYTETGLQFKHMGAYFVFEISKMPADCTKFVFTASSKICGSFEVDLSEDLPTYNTNSSASENEIVINFPATAENAQRLFTVPVPVGSYTFDWELRDSKDNLVAYGEQEEPKDMPRGRVRAYRRECGSTSTGDGSGSDNGGNSGDGDAGNSGNTGLDLVNHTLNGHEYIDLGITCADVYGPDCDHPTWHIVFAKNNIGAETETDYGYYFRWGELKGWDIEDYNSSTRKFTSATQYDKDGTPTGREWDSTIFSSSYVLYKASTSTFLQGKTNLVYNQMIYGDAATYNWGTGWMMPDYVIGNFIFHGNRTFSFSGKTLTVAYVDDFSETGVNGATVSNGENTVFFPAAGTANGNLFELIMVPGAYSEYWIADSQTTAGNRTTSEVGGAFRIYHNDSTCLKGLGLRYYGSPIRPIAIIPNIDNES